VKILLLADLNSPHTQKWASALSDAGLHIGIFTLSEVDNSLWNGREGITVYNPVSFSRKRISGNSYSKLLYLKARKQLRRVVKEFKPDVVHAHYATSYGLLGALSGFHPLVISVWGSDVMDFPSRSFLHRMLLRYNFKKADLLLGTSLVITDCIARLTSKSTEVIPFGIDTNVFTQGQERIVFEGSDLVVGTVKSLEKIYGIDILLRAFRLVSLRHPDKPFKLLIVGEGTMEAEYKELASHLGIDSKTVFTGRMPYEKIPFYFQNIDVFANLSRNESFGVSVLEAEACGKPVVVTSVGGLKEVILPGVTGIAVPSDNPEQAANAIESLLLDDKFRAEMGRRGRELVKEKFAMEVCLSRMIAHYKALVS